MIWIFLAAVVMVAGCFYNEYGNPPIVWGKYPKIRCVDCKKVNKWDVKHIKKHGLTCTKCGGKVEGEVRMDPLLIVYLTIPVAGLAFFVYGMICIQLAYK